VGRRRRDVGRAGASLTADLSHSAGTAGAGVLSGFAPWWNGLMRGAACGLVIALVAMQRRALGREAWLARTDSLTGVANRRHLIDAVTEELHRGKRYQHPFSLVMLDVDRFKHINDEFGHTTGDAILRAVAERLTQRLRHVDLVARVGGDEFALLLPETGQEQARRVADALSAPLPVTVPPDRHVQTEVTLQVQLSAGAATVAPTDAHRTVEDVLAQADRAMYEAKRNRSDVPQLPGDQR
jgi:diguanylate cyclase (GGDEF)-like protein